MARRVLGEHQGAKVRLTRDSIELGDHQSNVLDKIETPCLHLHQIWSRATVEVLVNRGRENLAKLQGSQRWSAAVGIGEWSAC
jgi:hypothetical protein